MMIHPNVGSIGSEVSLSPNGQYSTLVVMGEEDSSSLETVRAMRKQEESHYRVENYFRRAKIPSPSHSNADAMDVDTITEVFADEAIDPECRFRMAEWCYQIADFCGYKRETVAIAISCLDRFIISKGIDHEMYRDRSQFQLASMVCFYSSVKIHEHEAMGVGLVAKLSRGAFQAKEIEEMEATMLNSIGFRMNPPTALAFSKHLLDLIPDHILNNELRDATLELSKFQTEIAVSDVDLMDIRSSLIALAALVNSFDSLKMDTNDTQRYILEILSRAIDVDCDASEFRDVRIRLYESLAGEGGSTFSSSISPQAVSPVGFSRLKPTTIYEPTGSVKGQ
jgi:hypothetical protein